MSLCAHAIIVFHVQFRAASFGYVLFLLLSIRTFTYSKSFDLFFEFVHCSLNEQHGGKRDTGRWCSCKSTISVMTSALPALPNVDLDIFQTWTAHDDEDVGHTERVCVEAITFASRLGCCYTAACCLFSAFIITCPSCAKCVQEWGRHTTQCTLVFIVNLAITVEWEFDFKARGWWSKPVAEKGRQTHILFVSGPFHDEIKLCCSASLCTASTAARGQPTALYRTESVLKRDEVKAR